MKNYNTDFNYIIKQAKQNDKYYIKILVEITQKNVFIVFNKLVKNEDVAWDLTQETLIKMVKYLKSLKKIQNFTPWLNKILVNTYYDYLRKSKKNILMLDIDAGKMGQLKDFNYKEPDNKYLFIETQKNVDNAIFSLPQKLRVAIVLREFEGLSYQDIADITKTTLNTVKSRIARARQKLQVLLKEFV